MLNIIHLIVLIIGIAAYIFSDVEHSSSFVNTFLPTLVLFSFLYGLVLSLSLIYRSKNKPENNKSTEFLLKNMKEQGLSSSDVTQKVSGNMNTDEMDANSSEEK